MGQRSFLSSLLMAGGPERVASSKKFDIRGWTDDEQTPTVSKDKLD